MSQMQSATGHEKHVDNKPFCLHSSWTVDFLWKEIEKITWIRKIRKCNNLNIRFPISEKPSTPARQPIRRIVRLRCHVNYNLFQHYGWTYHYMYLLIQERLLYHCLICDIELEKQFRIKWTNKRFFTKCMYRVWKCMLMCQLSKIEPANILSVSDGYEMPVDQKWTYCVPP